MNCATEKGIQGAWWYGDCKHSNLNGVYQKGSARGTLAWGVDQHIKRAEMKIRPMDF